MVWYVDARCVPYKCVVQREMCAERRVRHVYFLVDGQRSIAHIALLLRTDVLPVAHILVQLQQAGYVHMDR